MAGPERRVGAPFGLDHRALARATVHALRPPDPPGDRASESRLAARRPGSRLAPGHRPVHPRHRLHVPATRSSRSRPRSAVQHRRPETTTPASRPRSGSTGDTSPGNRSYTTWTKTGRSLRPGSSSPSPPATTRSRAPCPPGANTRSSVPTTGSSHAIAGFSTAGSTSRGARARLSRSRLSAPDWKPDAPVLCRLLREEDLAEGARQVWSHCGGRERTHVLCPLFLRVRTDDARAGPPSRVEGHGVRCAVAAPSVAARAPLPGPGSSRSSSRWCSPC